MVFDSLIMMITPTASSVVSGGTIPLATIARRTGRVVSSSNDSILLNCPGYYKVTATVTFTVPVVGVVTIDLHKNGVEIPGITASASVETATTEVDSLALSGIIRVFPIDSIATLTLVNSGVAIDTSNVEIDVEYLG